MRQHPEELPGFDTLSPQDRAIITAQLGTPKAVNRLLKHQAELDKAAAEVSLHAFIMQMWKYMDGSTFKDNWHVHVICEHLEKVANGEIRRLIINIPPRHQKSLTVSVAWPAWMWLRNPHREFLFASYSHDLSVRDSVRCRNVIQSPLYQARWGDRFRLQDDQNTKVRFENDHRGKRLATSVGGTLTGEGGDIIVIDDPMSADEARSATERQNTLDWWREVMTTRLNDPVTGAYVIIMQRLHEEDLTGFLLDNEPGVWTHLCLPARYEPDHPHAWADDPRREGGVFDYRTDGGLLWPSRFPEAALNERERSMGPYAAAGQLQQRPAPRTGGMFQRSWFEIVDGFPGGSQCLRYWDLAATVPKGNRDPDWTVGLFMAEKDGVFWIVDVERFRGSALEVEKRIRQTAERDGNRMPIYIEEEGGASGKMVIDAYRRGVLRGFPAYGHRPASAKDIRAMPLSAAAEAGNVKLVRGPSNAAFLAEVEAAFANVGAHDDQVDAAAAAHELLSNRRGAPFSPNARRASRIWSDYREPTFPRGGEFTRGGFSGSGPAISRSGRLTIYEIPPSQRPWSVRKERQGRWR
ncbi:MAG: phage terminase large subunit [Candidatus Tectomicrobia bacterium]|nr:phage terminase large subunit [Candidatus Tectomicrobia bacterium]